MWSTTTSCHHVEAGYENKEHTAGTRCCSIARDVGGAEVGLGWAEEPGLEEEEASTNAYVARRGVGEEEETEEELVRVSCHVAMDPWPVSPCTIAAVVANDRLVYSVPAFTVW